jgi:hypothetical protein
MKDEYYTIEYMPYQYDRDLFYINRETYQMMYDTNHYEAGEIYFDGDRNDKNYFILIVFLSKEMIEKGMYYCTNQKAKNFMQEYIDEWIKEGRW